MPPSTTRAIHERREQEGQSIKRGRRQKERREAREAGSEEAMEGDMAEADDDISVGKYLAILMGGSALAFGAGVLAIEAYSSGRLGRGWRWLRVQTLGGVTTLEQKLSYDCTICMCSLDAHEKVRKLSCGHVFHCGGTEKCKESIEKWLCEQGMTCPVCRETPRPVMPWEARSTLSADPAPATSSSASASGSSSVPMLRPLSSALEQ